jgi:hypothetical protein
MPRVGCRYFDFEKLAEVASHVTRNLNKIIDVNYYPVETARRSNMRHRPIGMGVQVTRLQMCRYISIYPVLRIDISLSAVTEQFPHRVLRVTLKIYIGTCGRALEAISQRSTLAWVISIPGLGGHVHPAGPAV